MTTSPIGSRVSSAAFSAKAPLGEYRTLPFGKHARDLEGGFEAWDAAGLPLEAAGISAM
jgi:rhodanese-related sulfurtransferase